MFQEEFEQGAIDAVVILVLDESAKESEQQAVEG
jgi:hypothetical protein